MALEHHVLEIIAEREDLADHHSVPFEVNAPATGTVAWAVAGPAGSGTRRIAFTAERDVLEVGILSIAGVQRPMIRKLSGLTGAELWTKGLTGSPFHFPPLLRARGNGNGEPAFLRDQPDVRDRVSLKKRACALKRF